MTHVGCAVRRYLRSECLCARLFFFFNDTATTEIYTLSLHDALPILVNLSLRPDGGRPRNGPSWVPDRKSTRLNSSHGYISYAVFCLKKNTNNTHVLTDLVRASSSIGAANAPLEQF